MSLYLFRTLNTHTHSRGGQSESILRALRREKQTNQQATAHIVHGTLFNPPVSSTAFPLETGRCALQRPGSIRNMREDSRVVLRCLGLGCWLILRDLGGGGLICLVVWGVCGERDNNQCELVVWIMVLFIFWWYPSIVRETVIK